MLLVLGYATPTWALDPERALSQYLVERWGLERGYQGGAIYAIAQSPDGYLWIAAEKGLVRFDGVTFTLHVPPPGPAGSGPGVLGLAVEPDGGVWARLRGPMVVRYDGAAFGRIDRAGDPYTITTALRRAADGGMLLTPLGQGVVKHRNGRVSTVVANVSMPNSFVTAIAEALDGTLWLGTRDAGLLRSSGHEVTSLTLGLPDRKINALQVAGDDGLWIATDGGVARFDGTTIRTQAVPAALQDVPALALVRDRDENIWVALGGRGLLRITARGSVVALPWDAQLRGDLTALFEDREGNLWLGTSRGLERLRDGQFRTFTTEQGLPADNVGPIFVDAAGRIWMGPPGGGLYWLADDAVHRVQGAGLDDDVVYSVTGQGEDVWVGRQRGGLTRIRLTDGRPSLTHLTVADGLAQNNVFAVLQSRDGSVWAGTLSAGVSRYHKGAFTTYTMTDGLASNTVAAVLEAEDGSMWFGTPAGVSVRSPSGWRTLNSTDGLPGNDITALMQDALGTVWVGTSSGLGYVHEGLIGRVPEPSPLRDGIVGLGEDSDGRLWISTVDQLFAANGAQVRAAAPGSPILRAFDRLDGLASTSGVKRHRSVVADGAGHVWLSLARGLSQARTTDSAAVPVFSTAQVETIVVDDRDLGRVSPIDVPALARRVTLSFVVPGATLPERLRFRYRLDGFDADWSAPTAARQAAYTNLPPGTFGFRVMAYDVAGTWTGRESRLSLQVAPAYWQATWFRTLASLMVALAAWGLYRVRLLHVAKQIDRVYQERLAERTRIAQELHDTLLQGCLSASMHLHIVVDRVPDDSAMRPTLERVLHLLRVVVDDGRAAVRGLRVRADDTDLAQALARAAGELDVDQSAGFRVVVEGRPRPLHPIIRDEAYRIGREAIANALRHAAATHVEVELEYARAQLRLSVRDNGCGMAADIVRHGREGHWGLHGMRERAQAIRGTFRVLSRPGGGTEVDLVVPADIAYAKDGRRSAPRWRHRLMRTPTDTEDAN